LQYKLTTSTTWLDLVAASASFLELQATAVDSITKGSQYSFRIRARNIFGFGPFSNETVIRASTVPSPPQIVQTQTVNSTVIISFPKPNDNGDAITSYDIQIKSSDGYYYFSSECNSSLTVLTDSTIKC